MKSLFIDLYLDEDVDVLLSHLLRSRGFRVATTQEAGRTGSGDEEQLDFAASRREAIFTHNRVDFETLARKWILEERTHSGIIIAVRRRPPELALRTLRLLNLVAADEIENQIRYI